MSGLFVKDMYMPECCGVCPMSLLDGYGERRCYVTDSMVTKFDSYYNERSGDCPLEEREE